MLVCDNGIKREATKEELEYFSKFDDVNNIPPVTFTEDRISALESENADLRAQVSEAQDALIELAELIAGD